MAPWAPEDGSRLCLWRYILGGAYYPSAGLIPENGRICVHFMAEVETVHDGALGFYSTRALARACGTCASIVYALRTTFGYTGVSNLWLGFQYLNVLCYEIRHKCGAPLGGISDWRVAPMPPWLMVNQLNSCGDSIWSIETLLRRFPAYMGNFDRLLRELGWAWPIEVDMTTFNGITGFYI